jgi:hypothetical protein
MMLRTGIATLLLGVIGATGVCADDTATGRQKTLMGWLTSGEASNQSSSSARDIRRTASVEQGSVAAQLPPVVPNTSQVSGPQYFTASNSRGIAQPVHPGRNWQQYQAPQPVHQNSNGYFRSVSHGVAQPPMNRPVVRLPAAAPPASASPSGAPLAPGTALYPAPRPGIPQQVGGTAISNQFLNPHEMLYAHEYKAMYPPYSYKVNGKWMVTPFGVWSHEDWHLQGTTVNVKYKSHISKFAHFKPPIGR